MAMVLRPEPVQACSQPPRCERELFKAVSIRPGEIPEGGFLAFEFTVDEVASGYDDGVPRSREASWFEVVVRDHAGQALAGSVEIVKGFLVWRSATPLLAGEYDVAIDVDNTPISAFGCGEAPDVTSVFRVELSRPASEDRSVSLRVTSETYTPEPVYREDTTACCEDVTRNSCGFLWGDCIATRMQNRLYASFQAGIEGAARLSSQFVVVDQDEVPLSTLEYRRAFDRPTCSKVGLLDLGTGAVTWGEAVCVGDPAQLVEYDALWGEPACNELYMCDDWFRFPETCRRWFPPEDGATTGDGTGGPEPSTSTGTTGPGATGVPPYDGVPGTGTSTSTSTGAPVQPRGPSAPGEDESSPSDTSAGLDDAAIDRGCVCAVGGAERPLALFAGWFGGLLLVGRRRKGAAVRRGDRGPAPGGAGLGPRA